MEQITIIAPTVYPLGSEDYGGVERLVVLFARGLTALGYKVSCVCPNGSILPRGVARVSAGSPTPDFSEPWLGPTVGRTMKANAGVYLDFSHSKPVGRLNAFAQHISPVWHDPHIMKPPAPPHNVVALSEWQAERFKEVYRQAGRVLDPICADGDYFKPAESDGPKLTEDYCVYLGKLHPSKGALEAALEA